MKRTLLIITGTFLFIITMLTIILINTKSNHKVLQQVNEEYEYYLNKEIFGTELITLINKAIDNNKKYGVTKDEKGFYIDNHKDSVLIKIEMLNTEESYEMEKIFSAGTEQFIELFNSSRFQSEKVTYHTQTGRIATMVFKQIAE